MNDSLTSFLELHAVAALGPHDPLHDALRAMALRPFLAGAQPWATSLRVNRVREHASLLPPGVQPHRVVARKRSSAAIATGGGWTLLVERSHDASARLTLTASDEALGRSVLDAALAGAIEEQPDADLPVTNRFGFWHAAPWGARMTERRLPACRWDDIARNYSRPVAHAIDRLHQIDLERSGGRIILLHGPPGTGKTTALRALADGWRHQCSFEYVLDPERLLGESAYLLSVMSGTEDDPPRGKAEAAAPYRLLILEDCDELIRADAKKSAGQSLARLLNLTDGILGHGVNLLVAITTNEPLARLHPAVVRAGRCLAQIEVGRLAPAEARAWLADSGAAARIGHDGATLAELYAAAGTLQEIRLEVAGEAGGRYV